MSKSLVSVIIPVLNDQNGLLRCIEAISNQSYPASQLEVIVVDNGSDLPVQVADPRGLNVHVVACKTPGSYAARNEGVKFSTGEYLAFIDADCWPDEDWIATGVSSIERRSQEVLIGGEVEIVQPQIICVPTPLDQHHQPDLG